MSCSHNFVVKVFPEYIGRNFIQPKDSLPLHVANIVASLDLRYLAIPTGQQFDSTSAFIFCDEMHTNLDVAKLATFLLFEFQLSQEQSQGYFQIVESIKVVQPSIGVDILSDFVK